MAHKALSPNATLRSIGELDSIIDPSGNESTQLSSSDTATGISASEVLRPDLLMEAQLLAISRDYQIHEEMFQLLCLLQDYEIVVVCDDSTSMRTPVDGTERTRWDELRSIIKIIIEIGVVFDSNGVDIYFLNRSPYLKVKHFEQVDQAFSSKPSGYTPLVPVLEKIFDSSLSGPQREKKLLVFVATDGEPTDEDGNSNILTLEYLMQEKRRINTTHVSFLICTDDRTSVEYLNGWDQKMVHVDVTDDFESESAKIRQYRGQDYIFSYGDYVVKALVGAIRRPTDIINEP